MKSGKAIQEKIKYVHQNPVEAGLVYFPEDYVYSSASDYAEGRAYRKQPVAVFSEGASRRWGVYLSNTPLPRDAIARERGAVVILKNRDVFEKTQKITLL